MSSSTATFTAAAAADFEIDMNIPTASEVQEEVQEVQEVQVTLEQITEYLPHMEVSDLLDILSSVNSLLKKKWKEPKAKKAPTVARKVSPALLRNQAWLAYVQKHSMNNGWDAFTITQETTDKATGEKVVEVTERSASKPNDSTPPYTFKDAKTKETVIPAHIFQDTGKHLIYKEAMSLSAKLKWAKGEKPALKFRDESEEREHWSELFMGFVGEYESQHPLEDESPSSSSTASTPSSPTVRRLSAAEKETEREEKRRVAEEEKETKRLAREAKREESRLKKEREDQEKEERRLAREAKRAEKEAKEEEKRQAREEKRNSPPAAAVKKTVVPAKPTTPTKTVTPAPAKVPAASKPAASAASAASKPVAPAASKPVAPVAPGTPAAAPAPAAAASAKKVAKSAAPKQLEKPKMSLDGIAKDGLVHEWTWDGTTYLVNSDGYVWACGEDGEASGWVGMIDLEKQIIDTKVAEPEYQDE